MKSFLKKLEMILLKYRKPVAVFNIRTNLVTIWSSRNRICAQYVKVKDC
jgi:hypothetical protein